jgi:hypothetical protein
MQNNEDCKKVIPKLKKNHFIFFEIINAKNKSALLRTLLSL